MNFLRLVARPLLAAPFIAEGIDALRHPHDHVERIRATGVNLNRVPFVGKVDDSTLTFLTRAMGAATVVSGLSLSVGRAPRTHAAILAATAFPLALVNAPVWTAESSEERAIYATQLRLRGALAGALVLAAFDRQGKPSAAWRFDNWREQRAQLAHVRDIERQRLREVTAS